MSKPTTIETEVARFRRDIDRAMRERVREAIEVILDEELTEAHTYYERQCTGLGRELRSAIDETLGGIAEGIAVPTRVPGVEDPAIRRVLVKRFPYSVVFMKHDNAVWILAFAHHHRRPGYWRDRAG